MKIFALYLSLCIVLVGALGIWVLKTIHHDPLVTTSTLNQSIESKSGKIQTESRFQVIDVPEGKTLVGGSGTELIVRTGAGKIVALSSGVPDVTAGKDLANGSNLPLNHHLVIPVEDGRGFIATQAVKVLVKGTYELK